MDDEESAPLIGAGKKGNGGKVVRASEKSDLVVNLGALEEAPATLGGDSSTALLGDASQAVYVDAAAAKPSRVLSLDQFRGFVILYSWIMPMVAYPTAMPPVVKHMNSFCSLQDLTMPFFYMAIGMAMQLTLSKVLERQGFKALALKQLRRSGVLFFIGLLYYGWEGFDSWYGPDGMHDDFWSLFYKPWFFNTLTIIPVAQALLIPVIGRGWLLRAAYAITLSVLYAIGQHQFWFARMYKYADGGLYGTLSWASVMLVGTFLDDFVKLARRGVTSRGWQTYDHAGRLRIAKATAVLLLAAGVLMGAGVAYSTMPQSWSPVCFLVGPGWPVMPCSESGVVSIPFVMPDPPIISMFSTSLRSALACPPRAPGPTLTPCPIRPWPTGSIDRSTVGRRPGFAGGARIWRHPSIAMSQWAASFSMQAFSAGMTVAVYAVFYVLAEELGITWSPLNVLSQNALLLYMLRRSVFNLIRGIFPPDCPAGMVVVLVTLSLLLNFTIAYYLKRNKLFLRI